MSDKNKDSGMHRRSDNNVSKRDGKIKSKLGDRLKDVKRADSSADSSTHDYKDRKRASSRLTPRSQSIQDAYEKCKYKEDHEITPWER